MPVETAHTPIPHRALRAFANPWVRVRIFEIHVVRTVRIREGVVAHLLVGDLSARRVLDEPWVGLLRGYDRLGDMVIVEHELRQRQMVGNGGQGASRAMYLGHSGVLGRAVRLEVGGRGEWAPGRFPLLAGSFMSDPQPRVPAFHVRVVYLPRDRPSQRASAADEQK